MYDTRLLKEAPQTAEEPVEQPTPQRLKITELKSNADILAYLRQIALERKQARNPGKGQGRLPFQQKRQAQIGSRAFTRKAGGRVMAIRTKAGVYAKNLGLKPPHLISAHLPTRPGVLKYA